MRYWARTMDLVIVGLMIGIVLDFIYSAALEIDDVLLGVIVAFLYAFVEPIMLSTWGTTPGKALLKIRLRKADGSTPGYGDALSRAFSVWARGLGLGIPIIAFITHLNAYNTLKKNGITSWDKDGGFRISHEKIGAGRVLAFIALSVGFLILISFGNMQ
ncbi:MAG: RDD family protein [Verrucomicrobia bacterium]|nr:RDD family protein [Verrucomicrobiota bacterium]